MSRSAAWPCIGLLAVLSLMPGEQLTRTSLGGCAEHAIAYAGAAFITALAYGRQGLARLIFLFTAYAGLLEFLQRYSPGRTSSVGDFLYSAAGILIGCGVWRIAIYASTKR